jgi:hypothetical protein
MCDWKARLLLRSRYGGEVDKGPLAPGNFIFFKSTSTGSLLTIITDFVRLLVSKVTTEPDSRFSFLLRPLPSGSSSFIRHSLATP